MNKMSGFVKRCPRSGIVAGMASWSPPTKVGDLMWTRQQYQSRRRATEGVARGGCNTGSDPIRCSGERWFKSRPTSDRKGNYYSTTGWHFGTVSTSIRGS